MIIDVPHFYNQNQSPSKTEFSFSEFYSYS